MLAACVAMHVRAQTPVAPMTAPAKPPPPAGAVSCASASVCAAYLFPLGADALMMGNMLVLGVHVLLAGYVAATFERDGVLSNILCNRPKEAKFSASLFTYAALPFFALAFAIAVLQVAGGVDWGGGLLASLKAIGIGALGRLTYRNCADVLRRRGLSRA